MRRPGRTAATSWLDLAGGGDGVAGEGAEVAVLQAGPRRPRVEREREEAAAVAERQANEQLDWLRRHPSETNLKLLPAHLQERGRDVLDAYSNEYEAAQERQFA